MGRRLVAEEGSKSTGKRSRRRGILRQQRVSHSKAHVSICLLFVPSRPLVSSCSGPSRQDERMIARLIPSPGIGHDSPVSGRVVLPRALRFPPKDKRCRKDTKQRKEPFSFVVFLRALRFPQYKLMKRSRKRDTET